MRKTFAFLLALALFLPAFCFAEDAPEENEGTIFFLDEGEALPEDASEITEESEDFTVTVVLESALPYGLKGMPEGWELSAQDLAGKQKLAANKVPETLASLQPGVDYVADEVIFLADSAEYAMQVAEAYNAELKSCDYGVAVLKLTSVTVLEAVTAAADSEVPLPAVSPNYLSQPIPIWPEGRSGSNDIMSGEKAPTLQSWEDWYNRVTSDGAYPTQADRYLRSPTDEQYQYMHNVVNSFEAWGVTRGAGVTVAVIDSGVADHEDLGTVERAVVNSSFDRGASPNLNPSDRSNSWNHGTHVAGIIAGRLGNGKGGTGGVRAHSLTPHVLGHVVHELRRHGIGGRRVIVQRVRKRIGFHIGFDIGSKAHQGSAAQGYRD